MSDTETSTNDTEDPCPKCGRENVLRDGDFVWCANHGWKRLTDTAQSEVNSNE